jgi:DNA-binding beta-propeller fold protein YncE
MTCAVVTGLLLGNSLPLSDQVSSVHPAAGSGPSLESSHHSNSPRQYPGRKLPSVASTYVLFNQTLVKGNFLPTNQLHVDNIAPNPAKGLLYVATSGIGYIRSSIDIVNLTLHTIVSTIQLPANSNPETLLFDPSTSQLYVLESAFGKVAIINTSYDRIVANLSSGYGDGPYMGLALDSLNHDVFVAGGNQIVVINGTSDRIQTNFTWGAASGPQVYWDAYDAKTNQLLVQDSGSDNVSVFNATTLAWVTSVPFTDIGGGVVVAPSGSTFYIGSWNLSAPGGTYYPENISVVNATTDHVSAVIGFNGSYPITGMAIASSTDALYIGTYSSNLTVVNLTSNSLMSPIFAGGGSSEVAYDPVAHALDVGAFNVSVLSGVGLANISYIETGDEAGSIFADPIANAGFVSQGQTTGDILNLSGPSQAASFNQYGPTDDHPYLAPLAFVPEDHEVFLASPAKVQVDNSTTGQPISSIAAGYCPPDGATYDPENNFVYIISACQNLGPRIGQGYVTVLNASSLATMATICFGCSSNLLSGYPNAVGWDPATGNVWIQNDTLGGGFGAAISIFNASSDSFISYVPLPAKGPATSIVYDPAANGMVVTEACTNCINYFASNLTVYNASTGASIAIHSTAPAQPTAVAYLSGVDELATTDYSADNLTFYNATTLAPLGNESVGSEPDSLSYDPGNGYLYVANELSGSISLLPTNTSGAPYVESFSATPTSLHLGGNVTLQVVAEGWSGALSYAYFGLPAGCTSTNTSTLVCTPTKGGEFRAKVVVTDGSHRSTAAYTDFTVVALPPPLIHSFDVQPSSLVLGGSILVQVNATGGYGWLSYSYSGFPTGCSSENQSSLTCTPSETGTFAIIVNVTNANLVSVQANASLTVNAVPYPVIESFGSTPSSIYLHNSTSIQVSASGGYGWLAYSYTGLPGGCSSQNLSSLQCTPTNAGNYTIEVTVTNAYYRSAFSNATLVVGPDPNPTIVSFQAVPPKVILGNGTIFETVSSGGFGWTAYVYDGLPAGCVSSNTSALPCTPTALGSFNVTVTVTNAYDKTAEATTAVEIYRLSPPIITSFTSSPGRLYLGQSTTFTVVAGGGGLNFSFSGLPTGCASADISVLTCTPTEGGNFSVEVVATDLAGLSAHATLTISVVNPPPLTASLFTASPRSITLGGSVRLTVVIAGAIGNLTYSYSGLPVGCNSADTSTLNCTPSAVGTFTVSVKVMDQLDRSVEDRLNLTVATAPVQPSGGNGSGGINAWVYVGVGVGIALVVAVALTLASRKRGKKPTTVAPEAKAPTSPQAQSASPGTPGETIYGESER